MLLLHRYHVSEAVFVFYHLSLTGLVGEGNGNPLQYSCLENPRDGRAWWAAVYGVTQSRIRLKRLSSSSSSLITKKRCLSELINIPTERCLNAVKSRSEFNLSSSKVCASVTSHYACYLKELIERETNHSYMSFRLNTGQSVKAQNSD